MHAAVRVLSNSMEGQELLLQLHDSKPSCSSFKTSVMPVAAASNHGPSKWGKLSNLALVHPFLVVAAATRFSLHVATAAAHKTPALAQQALHRRCTGSSIWNAASQLSRSTGRLNATGQNCTAAGNTYSSASIVFLCYS